MTQGAQFPPQSGFVSPGSKKPFLHESTIFLSFLHEIIEKKEKQDKIRIKNERIFINLIANLRNNLVNTYFWAVLDNFKYKTIRSFSHGEFQEKGSKFIGLAMQVYSEDEVKQVLSEWKSNHLGATHLCYAFKLGLKGERYRANDDGEPNNSAGAPILGQLNSFNLTNILVGVVRYYGGTKLGVGGLISAYRTGAKEAILNGEIIEKEVKKQVELQFTYEDMPFVMNILKKNNLKAKNQSFELDCSLSLSIGMENQEALLGELSALKSVEVIEKGIY